MAKSKETEEQSNINKEAKDQQIVHPEQDSSIADKEAESANEPKIEPEIDEEVLKEEREKYESESEKAKEKAAKEEKLKNTLESTDIGQLEIKSGAELIQIGTEKAVDFLDKLTHANADGFEKAEKIAKNAAELPGGAEILDAFHKRLTQKDKK